MDGSKRKGEDESIDLIHFDTPGYKKVMKEEIERDDSTR